LSCIALIEGIETRGNGKGRDIAETCSKKLTNHNTPGSSRPIRAHCTFWKEHLETGTK